MHIKLYYPYKKHAVNSDAPVCLEAYHYSLLRKTLYLYPELNKPASEATAAQKHCSQLQASLRKKSIFSSELNKKSSLFTGDFSAVLCLTVALFMMFWVEQHQSLLSLSLSLLLYI